MTETDQQGQADSERTLSEEDQARVDRFLERGVNSVDRKPFRGLILALALIAVVTGFSVLSQVVARLSGVS